MKSYTALALLGLAGQSMAFPRMAVEYAEQQARQEPSAKRALGVDPGFNATAQLIDVSGTHVFVAPGSGDQRGPCPGLNALANHGYLPHNGVGTIQQFIDATNDVFGMGTDLGGFLAIYGAVTDGNLQSWSIGGPTSAVPSVTGLLATPQGISYSHNKYETDASPTRGDLYQYGNAYAVQLSQFNEMYATQSGVSDADANYNLDALTPFRVKRIAESKANNPYFFSAPFAGVAVQPAAYTFIYRFMSNKSAEYPEGVLNRDVLKSFFAITGSEGSFTYNAGQERIPENWYKRAIGDEYTIPFFASDLLAAAEQYPEFLEIGGNTGTVNSFTGVDLSALTNSVYNAQSLLQGSNLACFGFQAAVQFAPDFLSGVVSDVSGAVSTLNSALNSALSSLTCPQLSSVNDTSLSQFPGYSKLKSTGTY